MDIKDKLDQIGTPVDATKYRSMIGALMYLTSSRPDIIHATCGCARYQAHPTEKHLKEVKRIFRYLWGTVNMGLWYTKDSGFELTGFLDADYARCKDTFKSTSGGAQFISEKLLTDYGYHFDKIPIYCDSKSAIAISCNPVQHSRTKHIAVRYHFIKEHVEKDRPTVTFYGDIRRDDGNPSRDNIKQALDVDYAGCKDTFKSTSGGAQFLGQKLVSWSSKKQDCTSLSTVKLEYVSLSACCAQVLWMRT
nr:hypothetical protein [Tanacetum cinerariifolium]